MSREKYKITKFNSIRARTMFAVGMIFAIMLSVLIYALLSLRQDALDRATSSLQASADHIASEQRGIITYVEQLILVIRLADTVNNFTASPDCSKFLVSLLKHEPRLANIAIVTPSGDYVCNATSTPVVLNIADRPHFQQALKTRDMVIGEALVGRSTGKWVLPFAKALFNNAGELQGVLVVHVDLQWVSHSLGETSQATGSRIGIISSTGIVLARQPDPEGWIGKQAEQTPFFKSLMAHHGRGTAEALGFDGVSRIYGFSKFADTVNGQIYLWVGTSKQALMQKINEKFVWTLLALTTLLLISFSLVWVGTERWVIRPVSALAKAARKLGKGDFNARAELPHDAGELGQLAHAFDEMAKELASKSRLLRVNRALKLLSDCNKLLVDTSDETSLLNEVCRLIVEVAHYKLAWVGYAEEDGQKTVRAVAQHGYEHDYLEHIQISWADNERGRGPTGTAIRTGITDVNQNYFNNPRMAPWRDAAVQRGFQSSIALPLRGINHTLGALTIYAADPFAFHRDEVELLEELTSDLAYGIETHRTRVQNTLAEEKLAFLAYHDPLTKLPNRLMLQGRFDQAILEANRHHQKVALLFLGLDNFKQINDSLGHHHGDELLLKISVKLQSLLDDSGFLSRHEGDQFIIMLSKIDKTQTIDQFALALNQAFTEPIALNDYQIYTSFSIGISSFPDNGTNFADLLKKADIAMFYAKENGKNNHQHFTTQMDKESLNQLKLESQLRVALKNHELVLYYQAQVDIRENRLIGFETLIRWQHPQLGMVSPVKFIPLAERSGLIVPIGEWIIKQACLQAKNWLDAGRPVIVAVNISALQFKRGNLIETVASALQNSGLPPQYLELELTESLLLQDVESCIKTIQEFKQMGLKLSIDDFGTGYSSLSYLKRLAVDKLKIDQSFIRDLESGEESEAIVMAIIQLGHILNLEVIAEGVETPRQLQYLMEHGCDQVQGYIHSKPRPVSEIEELFDLDFSVEA